ncbi:MAG: hypothetical protein U1D26_03485 [Patescibacteria group bacterium]|nr:hypothetical protein [bacterium]MDZ4227513.1 hypothetical protein [Patescibacteria group bacterium]
MALPKAVDDLKKDGSKEDKVAVAGGIAVSVVVVLLVAWAIFFFRSVSHNSQNLQLGGGVQDEFNFSSVRQAQEALQQQLYNPNASDLQSARQESSAPAVMQAAPMQTQGEQSDQFGTPR